MLSQAPLPTWFNKGRRVARWSGESIAKQRQYRQQLQSRLKAQLSRRCTHIKGHGGLKAAVRGTKNAVHRYPFVARFDIYHFYQSICQTQLLNMLDNAGVDKRLLTEITEILSGAEQGLLAGSPLSPLLGALYLLPLDKKMEAFCSKDGGQYWRYMDDFVIFARTRHQLKKAIKQVYRTLDQLTLKVHPDKRYIGRTNKGFDFLGYHISPKRKILPARRTLNRLLSHLRQLQEQGAIKACRLYVARWQGWFNGGLRKLVSYPEQLKSIFKPL